MDYNLKLTDQQINVIGAALGKAPYEIVAPVITEINRQIIEQEAQAKEKKDGQMEISSPALSERAGDRVGVQGSRSYNGKAEAGDVSSPAAA